MVLWEGRGGGLMRGLKIPLEDFVLKMQGGGCICRTLLYYFNYLQWPSEVNAPKNHSSLSDLNCSW